MKWGVCSTTDLLNGLGGMEVHARCVVRELIVRGIDAQILAPSEARLDLFASFDVLQTHGDSLNQMQFRAIQKWRGQKNGRIWIHTLHGFTADRMRSCREWFWIGGVRSSLKELYAARSADFCAVVHPVLLKKRWIKNPILCGNGWDSGTARGDENVTEENSSNLHQWLFVGRGSDSVKNVALLLEAWDLVKDLNEFKNTRLIAVPGDGFTRGDRIETTGVLTPEEVAKKLRQSRGMILTSRYEGNSLAVLEALAQGARVVSTSVGLAPLLSQAGILGLYVARESTAKSVAHEWIMAAQDQSERAMRISQNQSRLWRWSRVVDNILKGIKR